MNIKEGEDHRQPNDLLDQRDVCSFGLTSSGDLTAQIQVAGVRKAITIAFYAEAEIPERLIFVFCWMRFGLWLFSLLRHSPPKFSSLLPLGKGDLFLR